MGPGKLCDVQAAVTLLTLVDKFEYYHLAMR